MPDSPVEPPKLVSGRFLVVDKPNPHARVAKMRFVKFVSWLFVVVLVIGALTYMSIAFTWGGSAPQSRAE